jgi:hypothetical protein
MTGRMARRGKSSSDCKRRTGGAKIARVLVIFDLQAERFDDLRVLRHAGLDINREFFGRRIDRFDALAVEALAHVGIRDDRLDFGRQLVDDRGRCAGRSHHAIPLLGFVASDAAFCDRWNVGQPRIALDGADAEQPQPPGLHVRLDQADRGHRKLHLAGQEVAEPLRAALIRHVRRSDAGQLIENHRREMRAGAGARRKIIKLAGMRPGERDEFPDRFGGQRRMNDERERG